MYGSFAWAAFSFQGRGFNQLAGGKSPVCALPELQALGVGMVIYSTPCLFAAQRAIEDALHTLKLEKGSLASALHRDATLQTCNEILCKNMPQAKKEPRD